MVRRVPILRRDHEFEMWLHAVRNQDDFVTVRHRQRTPGQEVVLKINKKAVSYTHLRAHETSLDLVCRLLLEKKNTISVSYLTRRTSFYQSVM